MTTPEGSVVDASTTYTILLPMDKSMMMSANHRKHWTVRYRITKHWRQVARIMARNARIPLLDQARIVVTFSFGDQRRRDTANFYPVTKAIVDGIVDAGVLADDNDKHVQGPDARRDDPNPPGIRVELIPIATV